MTERYKVYVRLDGKGCIMAINSDAFLPDTSGWTAIDSGYGDRYHHAQGNYLPKPIVDERGIHRYKLLNGKPQERTKEEMDADFAALPAPPPGDAERITALENQHKAYERAYQQGVNEA